MEMSTITKQMIGFHRAIFNNTYYGMTVMQDYSQNMMEGYLRQFPWVTEESKKPFNESIEFIRKAREDYKKAVDQGYEKLEDMTCAK